MRLFIGLILCLPLSATTFVWVRASGPMMTNIVTPGCTDTTPVFCTVVSVAGLVAGQRVDVEGVAVNNSGAKYISTANGERKIGSIVGSTISLQDTTGTDGVPDGAPIVGNGVWITGTAFGRAAGGQTVAVLTKLALVDGLTGLFDGTNGPTTRRWATSLYNGLVSIVVTSNVAMVIYTYDHGLNSGDKVKFFNTSNATFTPAGGREFTITSTPTTKSYTFSVTIANGNYESNPTCGAKVPADGTIGGSDECVRITYAATSTNTRWTTALMRTPTPASGDYRWAYQDAAVPRNDINYGGFPAGNAFTYANAFVIDQKDTGYLNAGLDILRHAALMNGGNAYGNIEADNFGNYELAEQVSQQFEFLAQAFMVFNSYMTATEQADFLDLMQKDIADASGTCTPAVPSRVSLTTGTAQGGSATTIQLASGASAVDGTYVNSAVHAILSNGDQVANVITAYVGATRTATVTNWLNDGTAVNGTSPAAGSTYTIWKASSVSGTAMTGYGTLWNTAGVEQVHVGDYMISQNLWLGQRNVGWMGYYVTAVNSDTSLTVIPGRAGYASGLTTPQVSWLGHARTSASTECGFMYIQKSWGGAFGSQPIQYPARGGYATLGGLGSNIGGNYSDYLLHTQIMLAPFDGARARRDLAEASVAGIDANTLLNLSIYGIQHSGTSYGFGREQQGAFGIAHAFSKGIVGFPDLDLNTQNGNWIEGLQKLKLWGLFPDVCAYPQWSDAFGSACPSSGAFALDYGMIFNRDSLYSRYVRYLIDTVFNYAGVGQLVDYLNEESIQIDPRSNALNFQSVLPTQVLINQHSRATALNFGWTKPATWGEDVMISRTGWTGTCDTLLWFAGLTWIGGDHSNYPAPGDRQVNKCGSFEGNDQLPNGLGPQIPAVGPYIRFGGTYTFRGSYDVVDGPALSPIIRWSGASDTGDPNSDYACGVMDVAGAYPPSVLINRALRYTCHYKHPGDDEIMIFVDDVDVASATEILSPIYYTQNDEISQALTNYPEGHTSCPGAGGCASLNTNRTILSQQDGGTSSPTAFGLLPGRSAAPRIYNYISKFLSPGNITINYTGTTASGHAEEVDVYGGTTVGGSTTSLQFFRVNKIATQPDTTLNASLLNGGAGWMIAQASNAVLAVAADGLAKTSAAFTTSCVGTCQVVVWNLVPGLYSVKLNGTPVSGSPIPVVVNDNSLHFFGTGPITVDQILGSNVVGGGAKLNGKIH